LTREPFIGRLACVEPLAKPTRFKRGFAVRNRPRRFQASLLRVWEYTVVQVPDADGVHVIVPDGTDPHDAARGAISVVLSLHPDEIIVELIPVGASPSTDGVPIAPTAGRA
jgi:hypothetical protein